MDSSNVSAWLTSAELAGPVERLLGREVHAITGWTAEPLSGGLGVGLGVWRLSGRARTGTSVQEWSLILKGFPAPDREDLPTAWGWSRRELVLYRSGLLTDLPGGLRAPVCYGDVERADGSVWVWLEEIADDGNGRWPLDLYALVARHLGRFNGAYLTGRPLPDVPGVSRGWLRQWIEDLAPLLETLEEARGHPVIRQVFPPHVREAYMQIWERRRDYYAVLERLPQTFCHLDAFRRNLFVRRDPAGMEETVAIDWAYAGMGAIGEDLAPLVRAGLLVHDVAIEEIRQVEDVVLASYGEGLREAGWRGDIDLARIGYTAAAELRYGLASLRAIPFLIDENLRAPLEQFAGRPFDEVVDYMTTLNALLVERVEEDEWNIYRPMLWASDAA